MNILDNNDKIEIIRIVTMNVNRTCIGHDDAVQIPAQQLSQLPHLALPRCCLVHIHTHTRAHTHTHVYDTNVFLLLNVFFISKTLMSIFDLTECFLLQIIIRFSHENFVNSFVI